MPTTSQDTLRIPAAIEHWKRQLLDLTKRNRALNFRPTKVSTIAVVEEHPAEVFQQLYLRELTMKFRAAPESKDDPAVTGEEATGTATGTQEPLAPSVSSIESAGDLWEPDDSAANVSVETGVPIGAPSAAPYDRSVLDEKHTDEWLQTTSAPELLDRSLRRIDEQARLSLEEQGVNTLFLALGMLHYTEPGHTDQVLRAPLVFLPVTLTRKSARTGYSIGASDDDPIVNPALVEYLRRDHGITLPDIPDASVMADDYDLQTLLLAATDAIKEKTAWKVSTEIYLSLFSFQKFVMYKDLEANTGTLESHRLIDQLVTRRTDDNAPVVGLPDEIRQMVLDQAYPPEQTYQVVDADSSQLRAIAAVARNYDLVIEGPPGTGKSQTITNLIAQALSVGKSVLFVAEKMAALSVVYDRLVRTNLGEFCLELHSTKANKRAVMKELAATLDASLQAVVAPTVSTQRLPQVRITLAEYVDAVHTPFGALGRSPYLVYGELGAVLQAPRVEYAGRVDDVTGDQLEETLRLLRDITAAATEVGTPDAHPWRDTGKTFYTDNDLEQVRQVAATIGTQLNDLVKQGEVVRNLFNVPPVNTLADIDTAVSITTILARSPGAPVAVLQNDAWNQPPSEATTLIARGREIERLKTKLSQQFTSDVFTHDHIADIAYIEKKSEGILSFLAFLDGRYRSIKTRWLQYRLASYQGSVLDQAQALKDVVQLHREQQALRDADSQARALFGALWGGESSDWNALDGYVRWVVEYRNACVQHGLTGKVFEIAAQPHPDVSQAESLERLARDVRQSLEQLRGLVSWPVDYLVTVPLSGIADRVRALSDNLRLAPKWAAFESTRRPVAASLAGELLSLPMRGGIPFSGLAPAFLRAFYFKWLSHVVHERSALEKFHTLTHEERVREFRDLDERVLRENRAKLVGELRDRVQTALRQPEAAAQMPYLRREMTRQRALNSVRRTMQQAGTAIRAIKPCFMMSPLTVAQLLEGQVSSFDLIIFDEASQLPAEDAVGAILRGKQLVVVGDPKQLPPTNFFSISSGTANTQLGDDGLPLVEDSESILEEYMGAGMPMSRLKWHYRSAHESLINFSNVEFYESDLLTFPSVDTETTTHGLQFEYLPDGIYEGKGLNPMEARRVADEVVGFAKDQLARKARGESTQTLGVGTFNLRQQIAIIDELEARRRADPSIEPFFDRSLVEVFFVKNLENIQGDERDVIFISVTYAKGGDGKLRHHFGPLNGENGWRRLNVLTTRARQRMKVFSSMRGDEINSAATTSRGAHLLREFLLYAERGELESVSAKPATDAETLFEQDVRTELERQGVKIISRVGVGGYRIDLAVLDDEIPGRFICGIECDGKIYYTSETARDRDRTRHQVLEARGWIMHRVWSTDWFKDRSGQIERLLRLIDEARKQVREEIASEKEAQTRAAEQVKKDVPVTSTGASHDSPNPLASEYVRPVVSAYVITPGEGKYKRDITEVPQGQIIRAIVSVVEIESPIHMTDLFTRVASFWDTRLGSRVERSIVDACRVAEQSGVIQRRGEFYWDLDGECRLRSRDGTKIPADRIAPEEYERAVMVVLETGHGFSRPQLTSEVRAILGFGRTNPVLENAVQQVVDGLLTRGIVGEGSVGIRLRTG